MATKKIAVKKKGKHSESKINKTSSTKNNKGKKKNSPQKRSTVGFEVELFILDRNGKMVNKADHLLRKIDEKKRNPNSGIVAEVGKNQIEVNSYPGLESVDTLSSFLDNLKLLLYTADEENLVLCPLASYPGKFTPQLRHNKYKAEYRLHGQNRFRNYGRAIGFHLHYELPWGVFDKKKLTLKKLINSKNKESLINAYNFLIAVDPAITAFMQSSPFYQGKHLAKDSRMLIWRGSKELDYSEGLWSNYPDFGSLPCYEQTVTNLIDLTEQRHRDWRNILEEVKEKESDIPNWKSILDTNWTPVKINAHGTLEQRGMDMNHILILLAVTEVVRIILSAIQENYLKVESSDIAIKEPFKYEKKTIFIPPDSHIKNVLQKNSAYKGFENEEVWYYSKRLLWLAKMFIDKKDLDIFEPLEKMIQDKKTVSDEIIDQAKKLGYKDFNKIMPADIAAQIALSHSQRLFQEIVLVEKFIKQ